MQTITNGRKAAHTIFTAKGPVRIKPGETRSVEISADEAKEVQAAGLTVGKAKGQPQDDAPSAEDIKAAIALLDNSNDDHWTKAGLPEVEAVKEALGADVTRKQIEEAAPEAKRPE